MAAVAWLISPAGASPQSVRVGDPVEDYLRVLQLLGMADLGSFSVRPLPPLGAGEFIASGPHPWSSRIDTPGSDEAPGLDVQLADTRVRLFENSRYPVGQNDGAVWQGRGVTAALEGGASARWHGLSVSVRPILIYTGNMGFELAPVSGANPYAYPWRTIDLPQRFGPNGFWTLDPGESELRLSLRGVSAGMSTRSLWWGPAIRNPIIMSNNAPGIPHAFLGTSHPVGIGIGTLEVQWIWGRLQQSDWFYDAANPHRFITGIVAAYSPSFVDGLSLGFTRVFYRLVPEDGVPFGDYLSVWQGVRKKTFATPDNPTGKDEYDQLLSLFGRWVLSESGFEVYWEWARDDYSWELRDFLLEPEYSQAYTLGLQKAFELRGNRLLAVRFELTHLEINRVPLIRGGNPVYYYHHIVTQGYTQRGQIIGAGIGPGGNAQGLGASYYAPWGRWELSLQRDVRDNDAYYEWALANDMGSCCHNVLYSLGGNLLLFRGDFDLGGGFIVTREFNRYFYGLDYWNLNLSLSARWRSR